ncbi:FAD-binding protein [Saccharopolyspora sp. HNM0983]|uniref:3-oxosteroid 1-dehydrogenase n=1 Tax=Saccharopolyspora montiporae TaxID=2781240 RepID=A0A929B933_9PSEU|nr:FAD-binding protein [Saccharopolyspora sp. HNM0983]MBE9373813.1 FAD-binding protein [Saccharopolyspora sp. HNM0983]
MDEYCDVLVVGSGGGALTGAYVAAREGLSVTVLEATDQFGGTTAYSGGGMWFPCNAVLRRAGDDDTIEVARAYFRSVVGERTPHELQDAFLDNGAPLIDYLETDSNLEFQVLPWPDYFGSEKHARPQGRHIVPKPCSAKRLGSLRDALRVPLDAERGEQPPPDKLAGGQALIGRLLTALSEQPGATLHREAPCTDLLVEGGAVVGASTTRGGKPVRIRARRGVLLAAGGFERNAELREQWGVPGDVAGTMGCPGNTGLALRAALAAGASTDLMDQAWWAPGLTHPDGTSTFSLLFSGGIFVDALGERFTNESWPYDRIGRDVLAGIDEGTLHTPFWMIYDDRTGAIPPVGSASVPLAEPGAYEAAGLWHSAGSLSELAGRIGVPADALERTVARFNRMAASGTDEDFHRGDEPYDRAFVEEGGSTLVPIERAPYHAAAFGLSDLGTKGGLRTDGSARVLDAADQPIPGLYAAGNSMAAVSGTTYPAGGNPIGASMVFSYLAARDMAGTGR